MLSEYTPSDEAREALAREIDRHEYEGNGRCDCGALIGTTDGVVWSCDDTGHLANALIAAGWVPVAEYRDHRITELEAELAAALAMIEKAPHDGRCQARLSILLNPQTGEYVPGACTCWKSTVDTSALIARDAETRRRAIYEAAVLADSLLINARNFPYVFTEGAFFIERNAAANAVPAALRALAEKGADRG